MAAERGEGGGEEGGEEGGEGRGGRVRGREGRGGGGEAEGEGRGGGREDNVIYVTIHCSHINDSIFPVSMTTQLALFTFLVSITVYMFPVSMTTQLALLTFLVSMTVYFPVSMRVLNTTGERLGTFDSSSSTSSTPICGG